MTNQTITALFDRREEATQAIEDLAGAGIPRTSIHMTPEHDAPSTAGAGPHTTYDTARDDKGFWASLADFFMPDEDRHTYAEAMHRGSILVSVTADEEHAARAEDILEKHGTVNIEEREASWREEGWKGYVAHEPADAGTAATMGRAARDETLPVVDEQLKVGKRQVSGGRVKVRSYVVETPVNEQVTLRDETVHVERRPMDRGLTEAETERAFKDRTIEAEERGEEAVMSKTARVTGEVVVKKGVEERTETVSDTVRSTKVGVEDERPPAKTDAAQRR